MYVNKRGRPPKDNCKGSMKRCQFGVCSSATWNKSEESRGVHYILVPQPCLKFRRKIPHEQGVCLECVRATKWLSACQRGDGKFERLDQIRPWHRICSLHFVGGNGPTVDFPDPVRATSNQDNHLPKSVRKPPKKRLPAPVRPRKKSKQNHNKTEELLNQEAEAVITSVDVQPPGFQQQPLSVQLYDVHSSENLQQHEDEPPHEDIEPTGDNQLPSDNCNLKLSFESFGCTNEGHHQVNETNMGVSSYVDIAVEIMKTTNLSVACSTDGFSIRMCDGLYVTKEIGIQSNGNLIVNSYNRCLPPNHPIYSDLRSYLTTEVNVPMLSALCSEWKSCLGIQENHLISTYHNMTALKTGIHFQELNAVLSKSCCMLFKGEGDICFNCKVYRRLLQRACQRKRKKLGVKCRKQLHMMSRMEIVEHCKKTQKDKGRLRSLINQARLKIQSRIKSDGHDLTTSDGNDFKNMIVKAMANIPKDSLQWLFLSEQLRLATRSKKGMRYHPLMMKLCVLLHRKGPSAYSAMREFGLVHLPSERTLRSYGKLYSEPGFSDRVLQEMIKENESNVSEHQQFFGLAFDEMYIKDDIVYDKHKGRIIGIINIDDADLETDCLNSFTTNTECKVATRVLQLMVRGLASSFSYPYAYFPCENMTSHDLHDIIWNAVRNLELAGFKIILLTCDGASTNRKFFSLCCPGEPIPFKAKNEFAKDEERDIYFISDAPHLIKTTRNCFSNSHFHQMSRHLWNEGDISWPHILELYQKDSSTIERLVPKLTRAHVFLTPHSKMKVKFATQVLSSSVASALELLVGPKAAATVKFIRVFNKFFDCLNSRNINEGRFKRNRDLLPFKELTDPRLQWLEEFPQYLQNWEDNIRSRPGNFTNAQRKKMFLSKETADGLKITSKAAVECIKFLLRNGSSFVLTHKFNQDYVEEHFSQQRSCGGFNENPNLLQYGQNTGNIKIYNNLRKLLKEQ